MDWVPEIIREGMLTAIFISGPLVLVAAGLGLIVGILQAATQVQEQTIGSAVKLIGVFMVLIIGGFYIFSYLKKYTEKNITRAFQLIPTLEHHPMPRKNYFTPVTKKDSKLPGIPKNLDMKKPEPIPPKDPSKIKARDMATGPDTVRGPASKTVPQLGKPASQTQTNKPTNLNNQNIKPASPAPNNQARTTAPAPVNTNNRNTAPVNTPNRQASSARPANPKPATNPQSTNTNNTRPKLSPELVEPPSPTPSNNQATSNPVSAPVTPVNTPASTDSSFSSAIEKLKDNAKQGDSE